jgi:signal transduction histidine kinase
VRGDADRLQQVIWNLLSNAVKFTPAGGLVTVRLRRVDGDGAVDLIVSDTGIGISPSFLPHVFERFRQAEAGTTRPYGGVGLGLAIVRQLVELHGGSVLAESAGVARGASFRVRLPMKPVD